MGVVPIDRWLWLGFVFLTAFDGLKLGGDARILGPTNLSLVAAFVVGLLERKPFRWPVWVWLSVSGFIGGIVIGGLTAPDRAAHLAGTSVALGGILVLVAAQMFRAYAAQSVRTYAWAAFLTSVYAIAQYALWFSGIRLPGEIIVDRAWPYIRVSAWFKDPNAMGMFIAPAVAIFAAQVAVGEFRKAGHMLIVVAALAVSRSRGAWLGALAGVGTLVSLVVWTRLRGPRTGLLRVAVGVLLATTGLLVAPGLFRLAENVVALNPRSVEARISVWRTALKSIGDSPVGVGLGNFVGQRSELQAHNTYLTYFAELGILGGACFLLLVAGATVKTLRAHRTLGELSLGTALVALAVAGSFISTTLKVWWLMLGTAIAWKRAQEAAAEPHVHRPSTGRSIGSASDS